MSHPLSYLDILREANRATPTINVTIAALGPISFLLLWFRPSRFSSIFMRSYLALIWLWTGLVFQLTFYSQEYDGGYLAALFFVGVGAAFLFDIAKGELSFPPMSESRNPLIAVPIALVGLVGITLLSYLTAQDPASVSLIGSSPSATAVFTLGVVLLAEDKVQPKFFAVPAAWAVVGGTVYVIWFGLSYEVLTVMAGLVFLVKMFQRYRQPQKP